MGGEGKGAAGAGGRCAAGGTIGYFFSVVGRAFGGMGVEGGGRGETGNWKGGMQWEVKGRFLKVFGGMLLESVASESFGDVPDNEK